MGKTKTIVDELTARTMPQFKAVAAVELSLKRNLPTIQDNNADINERTEALIRVSARLMAAANEVKEHAEAVRYDSNVIDAAIGHMLEDQEALSEFVEKLAHYSTLVVNLKAVFFQYDPKILQQVIEEMDPQARRKAWQRLSPALLEMIKAELNETGRDLAG